MMKTLRTLWILLAIASLANAAEFRAPVLLTSGGQSADPQMVKTLLTRESIAFDFKPLASANDLDSIGSVLIVLGGSSKGLGAAKVSAEQESARIGALLASAIEKNIPVLALHIGGKNRRGVLSDEFNKLGAENSSEIIVVSGGDEDGLFTKIAELHKISLQTIPKIADLGPILRAKFSAPEPAKE